MKTPDSLGPNNDEATQSPDQPPVDEVLARCEDGSRKWFNWGLLVYALIFGSFIFFALGLRLFLDSDFSGVDSGMKTIPHLKDIWQRGAIWGVLSVGLGAGVSRKLGIVTSALNLAGLVFLWVV